MKDLEKVVLFKHMTPQEISWMLPRWQTRELSEGDEIAKEGTTADEMFIIESGRVELSLTRGDVVLLMVELQEQCFFGELSLLTDRPRTVTARAKTGVRLLVLKKQTLMDIAADNPKVAAKFLLAMVEELCNRIVITNKNIENYFLVNQAIVDNRSLKDLYILAHKAPSSSG